MPGWKWFLVFVALLPGCAKAPPPAPAPKPTVIYLDRCSDLILLPGRRPDKGVLLREIVRQGFLLAAREEFGLSTRDAWLSDPIPRDGDNLPFDVRSPPFGPSVVEVRFGFPGAQTLLGKHEFALPAEVDYKSLLVDAEELSRTRFVEMLRKAGLEPGARQKPSKLELPKQIESRLAEMTFAAQFIAIRELHQAVRTEGEASALLGGLVRGYANLGVLTEFHWHPAHKVFKARSLLYAQRMVHRDPESVPACWHRAYAFAMTGLHQWALADLEAAASKLEATDDADRAAEPDWVALIHAHCRYEPDKLDPKQCGPAQAQLASLLRYLTIEQSAAKNSRRSIFEAGIEALQTAPECYRVYEGLCEFGDLGILRGSTLEGTRMFGSTLYQRLADAPGLPDEIQPILSRPGAGGGKPRSTLEADDPSIAEEFKTRADLMAALFDVHETLGEPSWVTMGHLIRELSFTQVWRRVRFERYNLDSPPDDFLAMAKPVYAEHRFGAYLDCHAWEPGAQAKAAMKRAATELEGIEIQAWPMATEMAQSGYDAENSMWLEAFYCTDAVVCDLVSMCRMMADKSYVIDAAQRLLRVSPHCPYAKGILVEDDWEAVRDRAAEWEKTNAHHPSFLISLGWRYLELGRYADAERCLENSIKLAPSQMAYEWLAEVYRRQERMEEWLATQEEFLKQPEYGPAHATVRAHIANYWIGKRSWDKALAYAEAVEETNPQWGLQCAAFCYEGMQQWAEAERCCQAASERYGASRFDWYFFCRRTGKGDVEAARRTARAPSRQFQPDVDVSGREAILERGLFHLLEGELAKALEIHLREFEKASNPFFGLLAALVADQMDDAKLRDRILKRIQTKGPTYLREATGKPRPELIGLASLMAADLAQGGDGEIDLEAAEQLRVSADAGERMCFNYFLGRYLDLHGKPDKAVDSWKQCMAYPVMAEFTRTLAGAGLTDHGISPDAYKELLEQEDTDG